MPSPDWTRLALLAFGQPFHSIQAKPLSGGDIHQAWYVHTDEGLFFVKLNHAKHASLLETETHALSVIAQTHTLRCPNIIKKGSDDHQAWLWLEYLPMQSHGNNFRRGQLLAQLHRHSASTFGWPESNFIGYTPQINTPHKDWMTFYRECRLRPQFELAQQNGASDSLVRLGERIMAQLDTWFSDYHPIPSLLHGDLWAGNSAFDHQGEPLIFDPASYYGDRETDLAMTELFGGFDTEFYRGYQAEWPLDKGYPQRKRLYQLYHVLNHFNLFGGHYAQQAAGLCQQQLDALR